MSDVAILSDGLNLTDAQISKLVANIKILQSEKLLELAEDVARTKEGMTMTKLGLNVLGKALAGKQLKFTKIQFGDALVDGNIVQPTEYQILSYTRLRNARDMSLPITEIKFAGKGTAVLRFSVNNSNLSDGFWAREIGVFAEDPDSKEEVLYAYKNVGALGSYIPAGDGATQMNLIVSVVTVVDQATNVTAIVDTSILSVTAAEFNAHVNSSKPHPNIPNLAKTLTSSDYFWAAGSDNQLHPITAANLTKQVIGSSLDDLTNIKKQIATNTANISTVDSRSTQNATKITAANSLIAENSTNISRANSRLSQTEINIANLYMQLKSEATLGLEANLLLAEDFTDFASVDTFSVKVNDEVAGAKNVCVEDVDGILEGHYYTLSDGVRSQVLKVSSIAKNDDLFVVFFEENLAYSFNLKKAYLYRSSSSINVGKVGGAEDLQDLTLDFSSEVWQGASSSKAQTLALTTTLKNLANFVVSGDYAISATNAFTLS